MEANLTRVLLYEGRLRVGAEPFLALTDADLDIMKSALAVQRLHLPGPPGSKGHLRLPSVVTPITVYTVKRQLFRPDW